jgi:hypothetical protein
MDSLSDLNRRYIMTIDHIKAMEFDHPEYMSVGVEILPAMWIRYREALEGTRDVFLIDNDVSRCYDLYPLALKVLTRATTLSGRVSHYEKSSHRRTDIGCDDTFAAV